MVAVSTSSTRSHVAELVAELHGAGLKKQTIRKTVSVLAMVLDHERIAAEPGARPADGQASARGTAANSSRPRPRTSRPLFASSPPATACPRSFSTRPGCGRRARAPHLGRRRRAEGPLARLRGRGEDGTGSLGSGSPVLFEAVTALVAREDRIPERRVFQASTATGFRTAIVRACTAAGVPSFSPHDLRHRRVRFCTWAECRGRGSVRLVGHDDLMTTARTYTHVVADEGELDYESMLS